MNSRQLISRPRHLGTYCCRFNLGALCTNIACTENLEEVYPEWIYREINMRSSVETFDRDRLNNATVLNKYVNRCLCTDSLMVVVVCLQNSWLVRHLVNIFFIQ